MTLRPRRSVLYMPGSNARALDKARTLPADALIFDLEDAVAPEAKPAARAEVVAAVRSGGYGGREIIVRINGLDTPWGRADLAAVAPTAPDAILIPKAATPGDVMVTARELSQAGAPDHTRLWGMIETPLAILNAGAIAATAGDPASRLEAFVLGTNDIAKETRARLLAGRAPMLAYLSLCVAAARAHGLDILDGVYNGIGDEAGFLAECEQGRDLGFDGKTLIHPSQIAACNRVFSPPCEEVKAARELIAVFDLPENAGKGAVRFNGRMVERMHAEMARRTVSLAQAVAALEERRPGQSDLPAP